MFHRNRSLLAVLFILLLLSAGFWGCDRMDGNQSENKLPDVRFINVPLDSTVFNYAPVIRWVGHDPDGMVVRYLVHDDSTLAAVNAYTAGDAALKEYISHLPASAWDTTSSQSDTIYLRRSEHEEKTQHIFMVRAEDDRGGISSAKVRCFFRTNQPPFAPTIKWDQDAALETPLGYRVNYSITDTLFWGDTLTQTYTGIRFLWTSHDPDDRELNKIQLEFSWMLCKVLPTDSTVATDTIPYPIFDDSSHVSGWGHGWSPWNGNTQEVFTASNMILNNPSFPLDGTYQFRVRVRDDGLTLSDTMATVTFRAIHPIFDRQVLIIDWNRTATSSDPFGGIVDASLRRFYDSVIVAGAELANQVRTEAIFGDMIPDPINSLDTAWYTGDKDLFSRNRVAYDWIRHFKWVWVIADNPPNRPMGDQTNMAARIKVMQDYMDVGGQVMLTGRRIFSGCFNLTGGGLTPSASKPGAGFLYSYFGVSNVGVKSRFNFPGSPGNQADFGAVTTSNPQYPPFAVDTTKVRALNFGVGNHVRCLPEVDYFSRVYNPLSSDVSYTTYNFWSCTTDPTIFPWEATNMTMSVDTSSTDRVAILNVPFGISRVLGVSRIYNTRRNVSGEFMRTDTRGPNGAWRIIVSTPVDLLGAWVTADSIKVDFTYNPTEMDHDQPLAANFEKTEVQYRYSQQTNLFTSVIQIRYRAAIFAFPLYLIDNSEPFNYFGRTTSPSVAIVANQFLFYNTKKSYDWRIIVGK